MLFDSLNIAEGTTIQNATIASGTTFPGNPSVGELFYHTTQGAMCVYTGSAWSPIGTGTGGGDIEIISANGISGTVVTDAGTSSVTLALGAITPLSVAASGSISGASLVPTGATAPANGIYLPETNTLGLSAGGATRAKVMSNGIFDFLHGIAQPVTPVAGANIDCSAGSYFTKTATGPLSWTASNVPTGRFYSFILKLVNGGLGTQTWFTNTRWQGGTAPGLTVGGTDILAFFTDDGGASWRAHALSIDSK